MSTFSKKLTFLYFILEKFQLYYILLWLFPFIESPKYSNIYVKGYFYIEEDQLDADSIKLVSTMMDWFQEWSWC